MLIKTPYYQLIQSIHTHALTQSNHDFGLLTNDSITKVAKTVTCSHNLSNPSCSAFPCGVCEVCRGKQAYGLSKDIIRRTFSAFTHDYFSITLSLPKWINWIPELNGCRSFGELFFITPNLFDPSANIPLNSTLSDLRKAGVNGIQQCFPTLRLGIIVGLHLANDFMLYSPHLHILLCGTGLEESYFPLKTDKQGKFTELGQAWRSVIGVNGGRGISVRHFKKQLLEYWADLLSAYCVNVFLQYKAGFIPGLKTQNIAYNTFTQMTVADIEALKPVIHQAILSDPACVDVNHI